MRDSAGHSGARRLQRAQREIRERVAGFITHLQGELPGLVTISRVHVSSDLRSARVYVSILEPQGNTFELLCERKRDIQRHIAAGWSAKFTPKLDFVLDHSLKESFRIQTLLNELHHQ